MSDRTRVTADLIALLEVDAGKAIHAAEDAWSQVCRLEHELEDANKRYSEASARQSKAKEALEKAHAIAGLVKP